MPPATATVCRQCGGLCQATRVDRYSPMVAAYGAGLLGVGYASLTCMGGVMVVSAIAQYAHDHYQTTWQPEGLSVASLPILGMVLAGVILGHFLGQRKSVWLCSVCGTTVERSERPEQAHEARVKRERNS